MHTSRLVNLGLAALLGLPLAAAAAESTDTRQLREEIRQLRQHYEERLRALEQKLEQSERPPAAAPQVQAQTQTAPAQPAGGGIGGSGFNPKISLILQGTYANLSSDAEPEIPGFLLGPETELRPEGFSLAETELALEANVDDKFHGWATVALENEDGETVTAVEEAYINTLALPNGLALKFGRFFSDVGYLNRVHSHAWDFVDQPLVYRGLLANQLKDDGIQLRWVAPTDLFVELGAEALRGDGFPGGAGGDGVNTATIFGRVGGDVGDGAWRAGVSHIRADADGREVEDEESGSLTAFNGDSDVTILDFVYKWAPGGNPSVNNLVLQGEYFFRDEDGTVDFDDGAGTVSSSAYRGDQDGFYLQGVYQFMPQWRVGLRYDRLSADNDVANPVAGTALETLAADGGDPERWSAMLDWSGSEFSRIRLQYNRDESRQDGDTDDQIFVQYIYSLGSHPAHQF